jgi:hypothetical protein
MIRAIHPDGDGICRPAPRRGVEDDRHRAASKQLAEILARYSVAHTLLLMVNVVAPPDGNASPRALRAAWYARQSHGGPPVHGLARARHRRHHRPISEPMPFPGFPQGDTISMTSCRLGRAN